MSIQRNAKIFLKNVICKSLRSLVHLKHNWKLKKARMLSIRNKGQKAKIVFWNDIWSVVKVPWDLQYDFLKFRAPSYLPWVDKATDSYYSYLLNIDYKPETLEIIKDQQLLDLIYKSNLSYYIEKINPDTDALDIGMMRYVLTFKGYYDIRRVEIDTRTKKMSFFTKQNDKIDENHPLYNIAKAHTSICINYFTPGIGHSWTHFSFPCTVSALCYNMVDRDSVLCKILAIHTRFTLFINNQALRIQYATANSTSWKKILNPLQPWPVTGAVFVWMNSRKTVEFYKTDGAFFCPPRFDENIPYFKNLMRYYREVEKFINNLKPFIEKDLLDNFITEAIQYFPVLAEFDPYDVLITFIWQVTFAHSADHHVFYEATRANGFAIAIERLKHCTPETTINDLVDTTYLEKYRNTLDVFVRYNYLPEFDNSMANLSYNFADKKLVEIENEYISNLKLLEKTLEQEGNLYCPLSRTSQSICF